MRRTLWVLAGVVIGCGLSVAACNKEGAPEGEGGGVGLVPTVPEPAQSAKPAEETAPPVEVPAKPAEEVAKPAEVVPTLAPEEIAKFAVIVAEIDCTADRFEDPVAHEKAIEAILTRSGLTREQYDVQVMKFLEDPTFNATREKSLEMCKATHAAEAPAAPADPEATLRQKMMNLAVSAECMRKAGATSAEMTPALLALYRANDIDLETYTREMARLQTNVQFQQEVAAKVAACPSAPAPGEDGAAPEDTGVGEAGGDDAVPADPGAGGQEEVAELPPADPVEAKPLPIGGVYKGSVSGGGAVRLTVTSRGNIDPVMLTIGKLHYRAKGQVGKNNSVSVAATSGRDWVQLTGRLDPARRTISGSWNGVVGGKRKNGTFSAKR